MVIIIMSQGTNSGTCVELITSRAGAFMGVCDTTNEHAAYYCGIAPRSR